ncbi:hypothetical protein ACFXNW_19265 [Nocardia sp. NPDC059180]|uniref:hypothetical protein n=1 Tax=Nocardia sp. NPDC059180 TaxID=3346761 RepID=UPI00367F05F2
MYYNIVGPQGVPFSRQSNTAATASERKTLSSTAVAATERTSKHIGLRGKLGAEIRPFANTTLVVESGAYRGRWKRCCDGVFGPIAPIPGESSIMISSARVAQDDPDSDNSLDY